MERPGPGGLQAGARGIGSSRAHRTCSRALSNRPRSGRPARHRLPPARPGRFPGPGSWHGVHRGGRAPHQGSGGWSRSARGREGQRSRHPPLRAARLPDYRRNVCAVERPDAGRDVAAGRPSVVGHAQGAVMDRVLSLLPVAVGVAAIASVVALAVFLVIRGPFGTVNDLLNAVLAVLSAVLAWRLSGLGPLTYVA